MRIRSINSVSEAEILTVAERMKLTLIDVMGLEKGSSYYSNEWLINRVRWHIGQGENASIILCEDEKRNIIGQAIVRIENDKEIQDKDFGYFSTIYVVPQWRRKGVARKLIESVHNWCESKGLDKVTYSTAEGHKGLISLFEQFGYRVIIRSNQMVRLSTDL